MSQKCVVLQTYQTIARGYMDGTLQTRYRYEDEEGNVVDGRLQDCLNKAFEAEEIRFLLEDITAEKEYKKEELRKIIKEEIQAFDFSTIKPSEFFMADIAESLQAAIHKRMVEPTIQYKEIM